ncbi:hypothetical protein NGTWS0302_21900 [Mycolicibacterium cyprinidarum]|uniref:DUF2254 domain-containing protein n=1 Tax=Mycolicibacterium cyprinidarum TaxID=2860311 RepID=A0ABQ4V707_9MYCO|nr:hypothetical protein NGTWS0302_21900 [Mycolicibacterium sp. NGTWS0302]GJF08842.1 hypothetical protein NGTWS1702_02150 [Mycolicibacterium sp. NGTWSNA01]GJF09962.1 hypothetical protein NGTWS1803_15960 [Mycolicibacterium sp. NGTWS1803]
MTNTSGILDAARQRRTVVADALRSRLWPVPALGVVAAVIAGVAIPELDGTLDPAMPQTVAGYLFSGGPDAARELLGAIATALITVTSLTFSLTLITLQLASSQYTPRLLRTFAADRFVQRTLALFLATFVYAITVLRTVRNSAAGPDFVPQISVTVAYLLAMGSVLALVLFLGHLVRQIRIETMLGHVAADAKNTAHRLLEPADEYSYDVTPTPPAEASIINARSSGFLVEVDERALLAAAVDADAVIWVERPVGSDIVAGVPVAFSWSATSALSLDEERLTTVRERVTGALNIGIERTATQDIGYGLRQLTDVVIRALSPGINDPTTAVHGLNSCSAILCELTGYRLGRRILRDKNQVLRVVLARPDLSDLLDLVCTQPQHYGASDPAVLARLLSMLRELAWVVTLPGHRNAVADRLRQLETLAAEQGFDAVERRRFDQLAHQVREALDRRWTPT